MTKKDKTDQPNFKRVLKKFGVTVTCGRGYRRETGQDHSWTIRIQENDLCGPTLLELDIEPDEFSNLIGSRPLEVKGFTWEPVDE